MIIHVEMDNWSGGPALSLFFESEGEEENKLIEAITEIPRGIVFQGTIASTFIRRGGCRFASGSGKEKESL